MTVKTTISKKYIITATIFLLITICLIQSFNQFQNSVYASTDSVSAEKNSTFSKSGAGDQEIGITHIISPSGSNNDAKTTTDNLTLDSVSNNTSSIQNNNTTHAIKPQTNEATPSSTTTTKQEANNASDNSTQSNNMQRGEYKVDANGIHYYNINNCSELKGSSGFGDLSECEDAEKEMREEM